MHIAGLFLIFAFLATRFPQSAPAVAAASAPQPAFASFVMPSPETHVAWLEAARTSWQVRSHARGRPSIGRLDFEVPLLSAAIPPAASAEFLPLPSHTALPPPDAATFALLPPTMGAAMPEFAIPPRRATGDAPLGRVLAFSRKEMLALDDYITVKEMMK